MSCSGQLSSETLPTVLDDASRARGHEEVECVPWLGTKFSAVPFRPPTFNYHSSRAPRVPRPFRVLFVNCTYVVDHVMVVAKKVGRLTSPGPGPPDRRPGIQFSMVLIVRARWQFHAV